MLALINSAVIPSPGVYRYKLVSIEEARDLCRQAEEVCSYVGYEETANVLTEVLGIPVPVNKKHFLFQVNDQALVCRLKRRVSDPSQKGKVSPAVEDLEFGFLERIE